MSGAAWRTSLRQSAAFLCFVILLVAERGARFSLAATAKEREILLQFKAAVIEDPRKNLESWTANGDLDPCGNFAGVTCSTAGDVEKILIHGADLAGSLSPALVKLRSLKIISLFGNRFSGGIPKEYGEIFSLRKLNLSRNAFSGNVPGFLGELPFLRLLDLSGNSFSGEIPPSLFAICLRMRFISLARNNLSGQIPVSIGNCVDLAGIDFSFNVLTGDFPEDICRPPKISVISLRSNSLSGNVASKAASCRSIEFFDIGSNSFSGPPPFELLRLRNLTHLNASFNHFHGDFPAIDLCGDNLSFLDLSGNEITGQIHAGITNCRGLRYLNLESNKLSGTIPSELSKLKSLSVLKLGDNEIGGEIPNSIGEIDLLVSLNLHDLRLTGEIPSSITNCRFLLRLDASGNELQGEIPRNLVNMSYLQLLDLHRNRLRGEIPPSLGRLTGLEYLDLSANNFIGGVPESLSNLSRLVFLNLSSNSLSGAIPPNQALQQFGSSAFADNPSLCGPPLQTPCFKAQKTEQQLTGAAIAAIIAAAIILLGVCAITLINIRSRRRRKFLPPAEEFPVSESTPPLSSNSSGVIGKLVLFSKSLASEHKDWESGPKALLDKSNLIGGGTIGTVYKSTLEGGVTIAVKKLETLGSVKNQEDFEREVTRLSRLRHPNLVSLHGYYWSPTTQLLLSEFIPNGNLHQHLHGKSGDLSWPRRYRIIQGVARALVYLHHDCKPQVLHLNLKATNVLLNENFEARLSDYGLGKVLPLTGRGGGTKFHRAVGYVAPELASGGDGFSDKCDVFGFGVLCLEIATGRRPVGRSETGEVTVLCDYVRVMAEKDRASNCFDRTVEGFSESEMVRVLKLGLMCTWGSPGRRPSMAEALQFLESGED